MHHNKDKHIIVKETEERVINCLEKRKISREGESKGMSRSSLREVRGKAISLGDTVERWH